MKDRFLWFCGGYAVGLLVSAVMVAKEMERAMIGVGDNHLRKTYEGVDR